MQDYVLLRCITLHFYFTLYICKKNGIPVSTFAKISRDYAFNVLADLMDKCMADIDSGTIGSDMASNKVQAAALKQCVDIIEGSGLDSKVAKDILKLIEGAIDKGYGEKNIESITEIMEKSKS